jgi:secretion/DNA translocation related TadE-like protein
VSGRGGHCRDAGFATVWVIAAMAVVGVAAAAAVGIAIATIERHRAAAAADAAALKVAIEAIQGSAVACHDGAALASLNGARLTDCRLAGSIATVSVAVRLPGPLADFGSATGRARAGPAGTGVS